MGTILRRVGIQSSPTTKETLDATFKFWDANNRSASVSAELLTGMFYNRYKAHYRLYPPSDVQGDLHNFKTFLTTFMQEEPSLAPWVVELFFTFKNFNNLTSATFCNRKVLTGWAAFERAQKLRTSHGVGEQSEFRSDFKGYGVVRV
jgi:hypothetical protein